MMSEDTNIPQDYDLRRIISALLEALKWNTLNLSTIQNIIKEGKPRS
jgi:hypothetical protein